MAKRANIFRGRAKQGDLGFLDKGNKKLWEIEYQQELEDFTDEDRKKPKLKNHSHGS